MTFEESKMTSRELQNDLRRPQNKLRKSSRIALRHPVAPRGAAQAKNCKPPEREHQFHRPARSTLDSSDHAAPPVVRLVLSPSSLTFSHLLPSTSLPPRRTRGVGGLKGLRPRAPTPRGEREGGGWRVVWGYAWWVFLFIMNLPWLVWKLHFNGFHEKVYSWLA